MNHSIYPITREKREYMTFTFVSNNAQGTNPVTKVVAYVPLMRYGERYFNLEFGDYSTDELLPTMETCAKSSRLLQPLWNYFSMSDRMRKSISMEVIRGVMPIIINLFGIISSLLFRYTMFMVIWVKGGNDSMSVLNMIS